MRRRWRILIADDERLVCESMKAWLVEDGYTVDTAISGEMAVQMAQQNDYAICFVDLKMPPGPDGIQTMKEIHRLQPSSAVIIITAYATVDTAITAIKEGAQDYIVKPCNLQEISLMVERIIRIRSLERANVLLRKKLQKQYDFHDIISKNPKMLEIFALIRDVADLRSTVLILGESGTGKEMIARAIHRTGRVGGRPFVAVPCAALTESLLESELFGYERGAFTGAAGRRKGKIEMADGGTLFLDEIGDITAKLQIDLLRFLQERSFFRVGGTDELKVDVRVIAATNANLNEAVSGGSFREDLFYRLNVINIHLPPLRERLEDIPLLARSFVERIANEVGKEIADISDEAIRLLMEHSWPGNIRELENAIERAIACTHERVLTETDFAFLKGSSSSVGEWKPPNNMSLGKVERMTIASTLRATSGNIREAARILAIDRSTLYEKIKKYRIPRPGRGDHSES